MAKMIAVWGSPNSGKTTTSIQLALALAAQTGRTVLTLFADDTTPALPVIFPTDNTLSSTSFGKVLAIADPTSEDILRYTCPANRNKNCFFLGYGEGENIFSYAITTEDKYKEILKKTQTLFDFVIVDCTAVPNRLSKVAMSMSDIIFRLKTPDFKSMNFFTSQLPIMADSAYKTEQHIPVLNTPFKDIDAANENTSGLTVYKIGYCKELRHQFFDGDMTTLCKSRRYAKTIAKLITEIIPPPPTTPKKHK